MESMELVATLALSHHKQASFREDAHFMKGYEAEYRVHDEEGSKGFFNVMRSGKPGEQCDEVRFHRVPKGFVAIFKVRSPYESTVNEIQDYLSSPVLDGVFEKLDPAAINHIMFRCEGEEKESSRAKGKERSLFEFGDAKVDGEIKYAGLAPLVRLIRHYTKRGDLGNAVFNKVRQGDWLMDYI